MILLWKEFLDFILRRYFSWFGAPHFNHFLIKYKLSPFEKYPVLKKFLKKFFSSLYACKPDCIAVHVDLLPPPILNHSQESNPCNRVSLFPKQSISEKSPPFWSFLPFFDQLKNRRKSQINELITLTWPFKSPYHGEFRYAKLLQNFEKL